MKKYILFVSLCTTLTHLHSSDQQATTSTKKKTPIALGSILGKFSKDFISRLSDNDLERFEYFEILTDDAKQLYAQRLHAIQNAPLKIVVQTYVPQVAPTSMPKPFNLVYMHKLSDEELKNFTDVDNLTDVAREFYQQRLAAIAQQEMQLAAQTKTTSKSRVLSIAPSLMQSGVDRTFIDSLSDKALEEFTDAHLLTPAQQCLYFQRYAQIQESKLLKAHTMSAMPPQPNSQKNLPSAQLNITAKPFVPPVAPSSMQKKLSAAFIHRLSDEELKKFTDVDKLTEDAHRYYHERLATIAQQEKQIEALANKILE